MSVTNSLFYFSMMGLFFLEGWFFSIVLPFHRVANDEELASGRLLPLDGLRGILALSIFFNHAIVTYFYLCPGVSNDPPSVFYTQMAFFPVSMFFFITAYLFWSKLMQGYPKKASAFWFGRLARLGPTYWTACALLFLYAACVSGFHRHVSAGLLGGSLLSWLAFRSGMDVNGVVNSNLLLGPAWSLKFEWLFYLSIPFLGWIARRKSTTLILLGVVMGLNLAMGHLRSSWPDTRSVFALYLYYFAWVFSVGILVAILPKQRMVRWARGVSATLISLSILGFVLYRSHFQYGPAESSLLAIPFACVCFGNRWFGLLSSRGLRFLGRISYSFYLLHALVLRSFMPWLNARFGIASGSPILYWAVAAGCGTGTILLSAFTYQFLEAPFLHVGRSIKRNAAVLPEMLTATKS